MQPNWLEKSTQQWLYYNILGGLMTGLVVELTGGLIAGLMGFSLTLDLFIALFSGLVWWIGLVVIGSSEEIKLEGNYKWSLFWQTIKNLTIIGLSGGLVIGVGLEFTRYFLNLPTPGIIIILIYSAIFGIFVGIVNGIITIFFTPKPDIDVEVSKSPNQEIFKAAKIATIVWIIGVPITMIFSWLLTLMPNNIPGLLLSPLLGVVVISAGGFACIQHFTLRIICWSRGYSPWNYCRFLEYATERLFLQRVGGQYRFVHNLLQEYFTELQLSPQRLKPSNIFYGKNIMVVLTFIILVIFIVFIPFILPDATQFSSQAMMPTIQKNDRLFFGRDVERSQLHQRGDIIWFSVTETMRKKGAKYQIYFRRIVGLPGEQVESQKGLVYIDDKVLHENYINEPGTYEHELVQVPADSYFFLGDNRNYCESDFGDLVPQDDIKGSVIFRY